MTGRAAGVTSYGLDREKFIAVNGQKNYHSGQNQQKTANSSKAHSDDSLGALAFSRPLTAPAIQPLGNLDISLLPRNEDERLPERKHMLNQPKTILWTSDVTKYRSMRKQVYSSSHFSEGTESLFQPNSTQFDSSFFKKNHGRRHFRVNDNLKPRREIFPTLMPQYPQSNDLAFGSRPRSSIKPFDHVNILKWI